MERVEDILKMIETVDPKDTAKLDEIDARVGLYLGEHKDLEKYYCGKEQNAKIEHAIFFGHIKEYTRSRDTLKAIRPDGWMPSFRAMTHDIERDLYCSELMTQDGWVQSKFVPTEELAELHAILQAIAYERSQNER